MTDPASTTALVIASAVAITTCLDKIIQIWWPNSRINSIFDVIVTIVNQIAASMAPGAKK